MTKIKISPPSTNDGKKPGILLSRAGLVNLLTKLEKKTTTDEDLRKIWLFPEREFRIGVTGMPGAGKSTIINRLIKLFRETGEKVGALLFDPASPISGGAVLADRARMQNHATDSGVFIRSFSSKGRVAINPKMVTFGSRALACGGFYNVIVESVGIGQVEVSFSELVDLSIVILPSDFGDKLQVIKSGILETGDILVVNKADLSSSRSLFETLKTYYSGKANLICVSGKTGDGLPRLFETIDRMKREMESGGLLEKKRRERSHAEIVMALRDRIDENFLIPLFNSQEFQKLVVDVYESRASPSEAAVSLLGDSFALRT